ncbi:MAG: amidohydrolase family protein [Acidobacteriota bacterium]
MTEKDESALARWLAQNPPESVLEPELPIIDTHHHLWDFRTAPADSFHGRFEQNLYMCDEFVDEIQQSGHNIEQTVFVETMAFYRPDGPKRMRSVGETEAMQGIAAMSRSGVYGETQICAGIVGNVDLRLGTAVQPVIEAHLAASSNFRGIRRLPAILGDLTDDFLEGYSVLAKYGLSFDTYPHHPGWYLQLADLARAQPDVAIVINHLGGWRIGATEEEVAYWREQLEGIAQHSNVSMKLGGAQMRLGPWEPPFHMNQHEKPLSSEELCELLFPAYEFALQTFGPDRCMFESNFPVDKESLSYRTLWNLFKRIAAKAGLSETEKTAVFSGTASRIYKLPPHSLPRSPGIEDDGA